MMPSRTLRGRSTPSISRTLSGQGQDEADPPHDDYINYFVAEDDGFLDAIYAALDQLAADCKTALRWSQDEADADAAIQAAELGFCTIASICKEAGLTVNTDAVGSLHNLTTWDHTDSTSDTFTLSRISVVPIGVSILKPVSDEVHEYSAYTCKEAVQHPPPPPFHSKRHRETQGEDVPMRSIEEIVEVELTDLMTQSHEEMLSLQREFEVRITEAEQTREHKHALEMQSLQEELASSRVAMDRIKQELLESNSRKLEDMHSAITASQRAIEAVMKDQTRYWKSICEELVVEKRAMAQKLAEERGRYTALKAHLANHVDTNTTPAHSRVRTRSTCDEVASSIRRENASGNKQSSNEGPTACISTSSTPTDSSPSLIVVPNADSVSEPSSAEVSPTNSSSSSKTGKPTFRRYYLAQKRENRVGYN